MDGVGKVTYSFLHLDIYIENSVNRVAHYKSYQRENGEFVGDIVNGNVSPQKRMIDIKLIKS